jgi:hypothetical protein
MCTYVYLCLTDSNETNSLQVRQEDQDNLESQGLRVQLARMDFQERREALEQLVLQDLQDFQELEDLQAFPEAQEHLV